jgi:DNA-binding response OmpR family regulator
VGGSCILLVEDEPILAADLQMFLGEHGYEVAGPYYSVTDTLRQLPSLALAGAALDVNVRGQMVFPVAAQLSEAGTPFLFMSGNTKSIIPEHFRDRPFLNKPFPRRKLLETLREITAAPLTEPRDFRGPSL